MSHELGVMDENKNDRSSSIIALFKPQFEAGRKIADQTKGIIKDPVIHEELLQQFREWCADNNFIIQRECASPITGDKGNREFFFHLTVDSK